MKKLMTMVMTENPHSIGADMSLRTAEEQMRKLGVRHLPVMSGGALVGILSDRDIKFVSKFPGYEKFKVEEAMTEEPYVVAPDAPFAAVAAIMAERKIGSVLVAERGRPKGIFTAVDGMKLLAEIYR